MFVQGKELYKVDWSVAGKTFTDVNVYTKRWYGWKKVYIYDTVVRIWIAEKMTYAELCEWAKKAVKAYEEHIIREAEIEANKDIVIQMEENK